MGMLALGLSYILVPMFALSAAPDERPALGVVRARGARAGARRARPRSASPPQLLRIAAIAAGLAAVGRCICG